MAEQPGLGFGGLLQRLRAEAGLTQEELAQAVRWIPRSRSLTDRGDKPATAARSSCVSPASARSRCSKPANPKPGCTATAPNALEYPPAVTGRTGQNPPSKAYADPAIPATHSTRPTADM